MAVIIVCSICVVSFGDEISFLKSLGISSKQSDDTVLAEYKDFKVTQGMVNFKREPQILPEITRTLRQAITRRTP